MSDQQTATRTQLAEARREVARLVRQLEAEHASECVAPSIYVGVGNPDPEGCGSCRGAGLKGGPYSPEAL